MSQETQQTIYILFARTLCACLAGFVLIAGVAIFYFGDGEGVKILSELQTPMLGAFGSLVAYLLGHQTMTAIVGKAQAAGPTLPAVAAVAPVAVSDPVPVTIASGSGSAYGDFPPGGYALPKE